MIRHHAAIPFWNLTYNDPNRWREVEAICGRRLTAWQGMRQSFKGRAIGSPRVTLIACSGNADLEAIMESQSERHIINFEQTSGGTIAYFKVRLELYGIPFRRGEWIGSQQVHSDGSLSAYDLIFQREDVTFVFQTNAPKSTIIQLQGWLDQCLNQS
ncbi:MAG: hypothetical protein OSA78_06830 [Flavobacteriales bacterium]|nr:hypothetical protein [Flavobacteriales bacterium]